MENKARNLLMSKIMEDLSQYTQAMKYCPLDCKKTLTIKVRRLNKIFVNEKTKHEAVIY